MGRQGSNEREPGSNAGWGWVKNYPDLAFHNEVFLWPCQTPFCIFQIFGKKPLTRSLVTELLREKKQMGLMSSLPGCRISKHSPEHHPCPSFPHQVLLFPTSSQFSKHKNLMLCLGPVPFPSPSSVRFSLLHHLFPAASLKPPILESPSQISAPCLLSLKSFAPLVITWNFIAYLCLFGFLHVHFYITNV